jgi:hypothetical protein
MPSRSDAVDHGQPAAVFGNGLRQLGGQPGEPGVDLPDLGDQLAPSCLRTASTSPTSRTARQGAGRGAGGQVRVDTAEPRITDVTVEVHTVVFTGPMILPILGTIGEGDWLEQQALLAENDRLFVAVPIFLAAGTRAE